MKKNNKKQYVTKDMLMSEIVERYPELIEVLTYDYGLHCVSCFAAEMETLGQGALGHGMSDEEVDQMLETLNGVVADSKAGASKKS